MNQRSRNTALLMIGTGLYLIIGNAIGFLTVTALLIVALGIHQLRSGEPRSGYMLIGVGLLFLALNHLAIIFAVLLISFGYFLIRSRQLHRDPDYQQRHNIMASIRWNREPWVLSNMSVWSIVGEMNIDLSLAIIDEPETTLVFQGIVGDIDIIVPDDIGVRIDSTLIIGQTKIGYDQQDGLGTKMSWQSLNFDTAQHRVNITLSYMVGDINVKLL
jgi:lia operon protein LiaF